MRSLRPIWPVARREGGSVSAAILDRLSNEATGQIRRNPQGGMSFGRRRRCSLLTDPLRDMLVARAWPPPKIHWRERVRIYEIDHLPPSPRQPRPTVAPMCPVASDPDRVVVRTEGPAARLPGPAAPPDPVTFDPDVIRTGRGRNDFHLWRWRCFREDGLARVLPHNDAASGKRKAE